MAAAPLRGRPRLRPFDFGWGFSRASIAVASREMCSTRWPSFVRAIRSYGTDSATSTTVPFLAAPCSRRARPLPANSAKARENVASLGSPPPLQPHSRLSMAAVNLKALDHQCPRRRNVEHCLGDERARQRCAGLLGSFYLATRIGKKSLDAQQFQDRDEDLSARPLSRALAPEPGEELLKGVPVIG